MCVLLYMVQHHHISYNTRSFEAFLNEASNLNFNIRPTLAEYGSINSLAGRTAWLALRRNDSTAHSRMNTYGDCESVL